jgi:hypothetical protein
LATGLVAGCILVSRFDDVSGGAAPDAGEAGADVTDAGALEAASDAPDADPGCGCDSVTIASEPGKVPSSLAVDELEAVIYWTTEHSLERCPSTGTCAAPRAIVDAEAPHAVAVGVSHIAWVNNDSSVWVLPKSQVDGGAPVKAANTVDVSARALAIDDKAPQSAVVFIDTNWLYSCPAAQVPSGLPSDCEGPLIEYGIGAGRGLVLDGAGYYYIASTGNGDRVFRCPAGGCGNMPDELALAVGSPQRLAQDKNALYWIEAAGFDGGAILTVSKVPDAGRANVLAAGLAQPEAIAADESAVYFTDLRENAVKRLAKSDHAVAVIARAQAAPRLLAVDATSVYWANSDGTIRKAAKCARCP